MANTRKIPKEIDLAERARFYGVCARSTRRWHNAGADLHSAASVALLLAGQRNPPPAAREAVSKLLQSEITP